jgi:hypothetical protein
MVKGLAMIDPRTITPNLVAPPVRVEELQAGATRYAPDASLRLPVGQRTFELHYTALSFIEPARMRFRYRLEGFDEDWVEAGARRVAYYTSVPPGSYRFRVLASNNSGVWNETGASLAVQVPPRFHETAWFYALLGIAGVLALRAGYLLRVGQLKARERELAAKVKEALAQVKTLSGLLPICSACKKIRDDKGYWNQIESYFEENSEVDFTHSVCPDCMQRLYPDFAKRGQRESPPA